MIYIEAAHESGMVLATTINNEVILENMVPNKPEQLWEQGDPDTDGYFNLRNSNVPGVMTAVSSSTLEIRGNLSNEGLCTSVVLIFKSVYEYGNKLLNIHILTYRSSSCLCVER